MLLNEVHLTFTQHSMIHKVKNASIHFVIIRSPFSKGVLNRRLTATCTLRGQSFASDIRGC